MKKGMSRPKTALITLRQMEELMRRQLDALSRSRLPRDPGQRILEKQVADQAGYFVALVREREKAIDSEIVVRVKVNRSRSQKEALDATGYKQYADPEVVATMPDGEGEDVDVHFFPGTTGDRRISDAELEEEFNWHGLKPDPRAQMAIHEANMNFATRYPNGTHWKDANGNWCYMVFDEWSGCTKVVQIRRGDTHWDGGCWRAGVKK